MDDVAAIGSTNMDSQGLSFLWEASVVAQAPRVAARLVVRFTLDLARSNEIRAGAWARRPLRSKIGQRAAWLVEAWI